MKTAPYRSRHVVIAMTVVVAVAWDQAPATAQPITTSDVDAAIQRGVRALLGRIRTEDIIQYRINGKDKKSRTVRGRVIWERSTRIKIQTDEGKTLTIPIKWIISRSRTGCLPPEPRLISSGGPSALAAFALLSAGVETNHPKLSLLLEALAHDTKTAAGTYATYVRSLRAGVWSLCLDHGLNKAGRRKYRRLLKQEIGWLQRAMKSDGGYGYGERGRGVSDNSNTQFANLGLWAGSIANIEVAHRYWQNISKHWLDSQQPDGGWAYRTARTSSISSMTVAGCNSLYIVLDRLYARADKPYRLFKGAVPNVAARREMADIYNAIADGDAFLRRNPPNPAAYFGYELFGLERLGLASGRQQIGGVDWFRRYAESVATQEWGSSAVADAFTLIFLVHGQAPVLFQKLEHGDDADAWNFYSRDLQSITRYLSRTFERLYRWQRIPVTASLHSLQDAPILYIAGHTTLELSSETRRRIRAFCDQGGTVFLHADRANQSFVRSATEIFEKMFSDRGLTFRELDPSHAIYSCHFRGEKAWKRHIPLRALADGPRIFALLCPVDIAGAWQQNRRRFDDLFKIMANVRVYCAPGYDRLRRVLRPTPLVTHAAPPRGTLRLGRLRHGGDWDAHLGAWQRRRKPLAHRTGLEIRCSNGRELHSLSDMQENDLLYLATRGPIQLDPESEVALRKYLRGGGLLLVDSADGQPPGNAAVRRFVNALDVGSVDVLSSSHPIARGDVQGGRPLTGLQTTRAGTSLRRPNAPPPIITRSIDGRIVVIACPFDIVAGLEGDFIWNRIGYDRASTERIVDNILLWRRQQLSRLSRETTASGLEAE